MTTDDRTLRDELHRSVEDVSLDLDRLTAGARRQGLGIRRRRQALSVVGVAAAAVAAVGAGVWAAGLPQAETRVAPAATGAATPAPSPSTAPDRPATGPATAAVLDTAAHRLLDGTSDTFEAQGTAGSGETWASLHWTPQDGSGAGTLEVNMQPGFDAPEIYRCRPWQSACHVTRQGGATLMTYEERSPYAGKVYVRRVADLLRADGVRVVVSNTNGFDLASNKYDVKRPQPAFSSDQLVRIARDRDFSPMMSAAVFARAAKLDVVVLDDSVAPTAPATPATPAGPSSPTPTEPPAATPAAPPASTPVPTDQPAPTPTEPPAATSGPAPTAVPTQ